MEKQSFLEKSEKETVLYFKVHTLNLINEIVENAIPQNCGVLKIPLNQFMSILAEVATRASQLNDPIMNHLMCRLTLYDIADPKSKDYNNKTLNDIEKLSENQRLKEESRSSS